MAGYRQKQYPVLPDGDWMQTDAYANANSVRRRQLTRYKKENGVGDEHMYLLLRKEELDDVSKDERDQSDRLGQFLVVIAGLLLVSGISSGSLEGWAILPSLGVFVFVIVLNAIGIISPYRRAVRTVKVSLKKMPEVVDFEEWNVANPPKEHPQPQQQKSGKKKRRHH